MVCLVPKLCDTIQASGHVLISLHASYHLTPNTAEAVPHVSIIRSGAPSTAVYGMLCAREKANLIEKVPHQLSMLTQLILYIHLLWLVS